MMKPSVKDSIKKKLNQTKPTTESQQTQDPQKKPPLQRSSLIKSKPPQQSQQQQASEIPIKKDSYTSKFEKRNSTQNQNQNQARTSSQQKRNSTQGTITTNPKYKHITSSYAQKPIQKLDINEDLEDKESVSIELFQKLKSQYENLQGKFHQEQEENNLLQQEIQALKQQNYEYTVKIKEEKLDKTRLKQKIQAIQIQLNGVQSELQEKNETISKYMNQKNQQFDERRNFILNGQLQKQRRYIQHLTKMIKSTKVIQTELEYQLNYIIDLIETELFPNNNNTFQNPNEQQKKKKKTFDIDTVQKFHAQISGMREKYKELQNQNNCEFAQNLLKEFDQSSNKQVSQKHLIISLQDKANNLIQSMLKKQEIQLQKQNLKNQEEKFNILNSMNKNTFNIDKNIITNLRDFVNECLNYGLEVKIDENEFEPGKTSDELKNETQLSLCDKLNENKEIWDKLRQNNNIMKYADKVKIDRDFICKRYTKETFLDAYLNFEQSQQKNKKKSIEIFLQKLQNLVRFDLNIYEKQNNLTQVFLYETQRILQNLNQHTRKLIAQIEQKIKAEIFDPFQDMYQIYMKFFLTDNSPSYPINLANVFNMHVENMNNCLLNLVGISHNDEEMYEEIQLANTPYLEQVYNAYEEFYKNSIKL